jgi:hypothetical protein
MEVAGFIIAGPLGTKAAGSLNAEALRVGSSILSATAWGVSAAWADWTSAQADTGQQRTGTLHECSFVGGGVQRDYRSPLAAACMMLSILSRMSLACFDSSASMPILPFTVSSQAISQSRVMTQICLLASSMMAMRQGR